MVAGLAAITMLVGCGGGSAGEASRDGPSSGAAPTPSADTAPTTQLSVPEGIYDTSRGWESELPGGYAVLPHTKMIAFYPAGELGVTVECQLLEGAEPPTGNALLSSNRRYLAGSMVVLDLETGSGRCYAPTDTNKGVGFRGVTDTGTAFGAVAVADADSEDATKPVLIDVATGDVTEGDSAWLFPDHDVGGFGLFRDLSSEVVVAYPHAR